MGFRVMLTLAPDAPRWATAGAQGGNYKVSATEFASFARAVGGRYSGAFCGVPAVRYFSIWNEPNHITSSSRARRRPHLPRSGRKRRARLCSANAAPDAKIFVGELAPVGRHQGDRAH